VEARSVRIRTAGRSWPIQDPDAHLASGSDSQHLQQVSRAPVGKSHIAGIRDFTRLEEDQVHCGSLMVESITVAVNAHVAAADSQTPGIARLFVM
jgi:hypothetical protein